MDDRSQSHRTTDPVPIPGEMVGERRFDLFVAGLFFLSCLAYALMRLIVSPTMELDEAEQFLAGSEFRWGYEDQPPLYSWIVKAASSLFGMHLGTLLAVKYGMLFLFYLSFYLLARTSWRPGTSLLATGSLMLFPVYAYEFTRDLSHTLLVSLIACVTCLHVVRLMTTQEKKYYLYLGLTIGLGILSKYNFLLFLAALTLAGMSLHQGRAAFLNRRILLAIGISSLILLPHVLWLLQNDFPSLHHAVTKAKVSRFGARPLGVLGSAFSGVAIYVITFLAFFRRDLSARSPAVSAGAHALAIFPLFRRIALFGLVLTLLAIAILQPGRFTERWIAPIAFTIPLAAFSLIPVDMRLARHRLFATLCIVIAVGVFLLRGVIGFMPGVTGKAERIHVPFQSLSLQLEERLKESGIDSRTCALITNNEHIAANTIAWLPRLRFISLTEAAKEETRREIERTGGVLIWHQTTPGTGLPAGMKALFPSAIVLRPIEAPHLRAPRLPPYTLGIALVGRAMSRSVYSSSVHS